MRAVLQLHQASPLGLAAWGPGKPCGIKSAIKTDRSKYRCAFCTRAATRAAPGHPGLRRGGVFVVYRLTNAQTRTAVKSSVLAGVLRALTHGTVMERERAEFTPTHPPVSVSVAHVRSDSPLAHEEASNKRQTCSAAGASPYPCRIVPYPRLHLSSTCAERFPGASPLSHATTSAGLVAQLPLPLVTPPSPAHSPARQQTGIHPICCYTGRRERRALPR